MHKIFVYGMLRSRGSSGYLHDQICHGPARTAQKYDMYSLINYPAICREGNTTVVGEVYEIDDGMLEELDRLEGHPRYYQRESIELDDGQIVEAYFMDRMKIQNRSQVVCGDWQKYEHARNIADSLRDRVGELVHDVMAAEPDVVFALVEFLQTDAGCAREDDNEVEADAIFDFCEGLLKIASR